MAPRPLLLGLFLSPFLAACVRQTSEAKDEWWGPLARKSKTHDGLFDCDAEAKLWSIAWSQLKKSYCCRKSGLSCEVMVFDATDEEGDMIISRQSTTLYSGESAVYSFTAEHYMKEFVAETECAEPVFVKKGDGKLCSVGSFTTPRLNCAAGAFDLDALETLSGLAPKSERGFGLEFEFVARPVTKQLIDETYAMFTESGHSHQTIVEHLRRPAGKVQALNMCALGVIASLPEEDAELLQHWNWETDSSVHPLTEREVNALGLGADETAGTPFEVTAPGPPHVLSGASGFRSSMLMMEALKIMGIQAGPSQGMHVHVNVLSDRAPGAKLTTTQVAHVWAAYAKYQLVIDEFLSPSRPGNNYANRLFLGNCTAASHNAQCSTNPCGCLRSFFGRMHDALKKGDNHDPSDFCNYVLQLPGGSKTPCKEKYPHQRYFQLNLVPMNKFGTIEFRAHSATYDPERVFRYLQFLVAFVEYFGRGNGSKDMAKFFSSSEATDDYSKLSRAQRDATVDDLFKELHGHVDAGSKEFFTSRRWETNDVGCNATGKPQLQFPSCSAHDDIFQQQDGGNLEQIMQMFGLGGLGFSMAQTTEHTSGNHTIRATVPRGREPGSYLQVMMPEGNVRAELLNHDAVHRGYHEFTYDPQEADHHLILPQRSSN